jgi:hypothetical protein
MIRALEEKLGAKVYVFPRPEFACALGAALLGLQRLQKIQPAAGMMPAVQAAERLEAGVIDAVRR